MGCRRALTATLGLSPAQNGQVNRFLSEAPEARCRAGAAIMNLNGGRLKAKSVRRGSVVRTDERF